MEPARVTRRTSHLFDHRGEIVAYITLVVIALSMIAAPDDLQLEAAIRIEQRAMWPFQWAGQMIDRLDSIERENRRLGALAEELRLELVRTREVHLENERLRAMLGLSERRGVRMIGCEILGRGGGRLGNETLHLDRGAGHGVTVDMPVTCAAGVVGKVHRVYDTSCDAHLLTHRWTRVGVRGTRSRVTGVVEWNPLDPATLKLRGVSYLEDLVPGDSLVTSGMGGIYPDGLRVGVVEEVGRDAGGLLLDVTVRPAVDFSRLEEVFVLVETPADSTGRPVATGRDAAAGEGGTDAVVELR
ncbi:MAG: rod shape-determining protein MreC [Candidatus Eiseniibacteriota bacterium]|jgi:rod shape-determining protein MreC